MKAFAVLWKKELTGYFFSPIAYVVAVFFLASIGLIFSLLVSILAEGPAGISIMNLLFGSPFYWMSMLVLAPVLTMRLLAEEKKSGTIETLLTAPITDAQVVLAKFLGAICFYAFLWLPTGLFLLILRYFSVDMAPLDLGAVAGGYLGALLVGMLYLSIGLLCSALTSNQIIAAVCSFAVLLILFLAGLVEQIARDSAVRAVSSYISSYVHMLEFSRGVIDSRPIVFYLSSTALVLFATVKVVESRTWK
ncbi:MAG: ABC transporter permease [Kiritimatiellae bacterium]|nr:ABC transporter permease [Kiritimatiellia bacterium]MDW8458446.1 ABC transporter permease [Verrucomicrobiota bacterium]